MKFLNLAPRSKSDLPSYLSGTALCVTRTEHTAARQVCLPQSRRLLSWHRQHFHKPLPPFPFRKSHTFFLPLSVTPLQNTGMGAYNERQFNGINICYSSITDYFYNFDYGPKFQGRGHMSVSPSPCQRPCLYSQTLQHLNQACQTCGPLQAHLRPAKRIL